MRALNNITLLGAAIGLAAAFCTVIINLHNGFNSFIWPLVSIGWIVNWFIAARAYDRIKDDY